MHQPNIPDPIEQAAVILELCHGDLDAAREICFTNLDALHECRRISFWDSVLGVLTVKGTA